MKILHFRLVKQNIYLLMAVVIPLFGFALIITRNYYLLIPSILLITMILKQWKYLLLTLVFLCGLLVIYYLTVSEPVENKIRGQYEVVKKTSFGFIIKVGGNRVFVFSRADVFLGDQLYISGQSYFYKGKMKNYLLSQNIKSVLSHPFVVKIKSSQSIPNQMREILINGNTNYDQITSLLFFGEKTISNRSFYKQAVQMNIAHLFVISGFHISLLHLAVRKMMFLMPDLGRDITSFIVILNYLFIINFPISALRAAIMLFIFVLTKHLKKVKLTRIEIMAISLMIVVLIYPYSVFGFSLPLTFISTFAILNILDLQIKEYQKMLMIPFVMFVLMLPFVIAFNGQISIWGPLYGLLITPVFTIFYLVFMLLLPFRAIASTWCDWFVNFLKQMQQINFSIAISKTIAWFFFSPYLFSGLSFIIYEVWSSYLAPRNI